MRRALLSLCLGVSALLLGSGDAMADTGGAVITDEGGADVEATLSGSASGGGGGGASESDCYYRPIVRTDEFTVFNLDGSPIATDGTGQWYERWCGSVFLGAVYISPADPAALLVEARRRLDLPAPQPQLSPADQQLVNLPAWLWIEPSGWRTRSASASVPGVVVTVAASPETAIWSMGDGTSLSCGSGTPYDPSLPVSDQSTDCSHIYLRSSAHQPGLAYDAAVTIRWRLSWTVTGAAGGGSLGTIDRTTSFSVPVAEIQTVNVASRGES